MGAFPSDLQVSTSLPQSAPAMTVRTTQSPLQGGALRSKGTLQGAVVRLGSVC